MNELTRPNYRISSYILVTALYVLYVVVFAAFHARVGDGIASLALIPVIAGSWYFGIRGGMLVAILSILANVILLTTIDQPLDVVLLNPGNDVRIFALILIAVFVGRLGTVTRERGEALAKLEALEKDRQAHTKFLELLNEMTGTALEADNPGMILKSFVEQIGKLFEAEDCFFARWDDANAITLPITAYGSLSDTYPLMRFEPGERTLTASIMEASRPIAISDTENSPYISPQVASLFSSKSMLGVPLIVQGRKLGALILGYDKSRQFDPNEISRAEIAAEQIALVLLKTQLLEEAQKQVAELSALHDVALASIQADSEDQLIKHITDIIGQNLFPDNFGIMLLDENTETLHTHPSYRFFSRKELHTVEMALGEGITGQVAKTGKAQRIGNVSHTENYRKVDERTFSELCVPIKLKQRILGVINAESIKKDAFTNDDERLMITIAGQLATAIEQMRKAQTERKWLDQLAHSNDLIYALAHVTTHIEGALTPDEIIQVLCVELNKIRLTSVVVAYDSDQRSFTINHTSMEPEVLDQLENDIGFPLIQHIISLDEMNSVLETENLLAPAVISNPENEIQVLFAQGQMKGISKILPGIGITPEIKLLRLPLLFEENLLGILWVWGEGIIKADLPMMSIFTKQIGISLERARLFQEVQSLALTDPLTGLHNRRSLFELGRIEFSRAERFNRPLCCLMLDLDNFKQVNDLYGHQKGDKVLQEFARRCKDTIREIDLLGRYGGEELIILMPETDIETATQVAERLRSSICENQLKIADQELNLTVSIGIATKDRNTLELETLIARADQAMYIAKHKGRNRVAVSK